MHTMLMPFSLQLIVMGSPYIDTCRSRDNWSVISAIAVLLNLIAKILGEIFASTNHKITNLHALTQVIKVSTGRTIFESFIALE